MYVMYVNRMTMQIEIRGSKKFDNVNRNNFNRGDVNRRITVTVIVTVENIL